MKRHTRWLLVVTVLVAVAALGIGWSAMANERSAVALDPEQWAPAWQEGAEEFVPGEYLVRFVPDVFRIVPYVPSFLVFSSIGYATRGNIFSEYMRLGKIW